MIHYHGAPMSGSMQDAAQFFIGRHALVSHLDVKHLPVILDVASSFILDNGAYTAYTQGVEVDFDMYALWVESLHRHPGFDFAIIPDQIGGGEDENDALLAEWPAHLRGVPVWHPNETLVRLELLAHRFDTIAIGGAKEYYPGSGVWWNRISDALDLITDNLGRPITRLHGLRLLDPDIFQYIPLRSADSANASRNSTQIYRFGQYDPPTAAARASAIATRIEHMNSPPVWKRREQLDLYRDLFDAAEK